MAKIVAVNHNDARTLLASGRRGIKRWNRQREKLGDVAWKGLQLHPKLTMIEQPVCGTPRTNTVPIVTDDGVLTLYSGEGNPPSGTPSTAVARWNRGRMGKGQVADLRGVKLRGADLRQVNFSGLDLSQADLSQADLRGASLAGANFRGATLRDTDLSFTDLAGADLTGADFSGAGFVDAAFYEGKAIGATGRQANFQQANLYQCDLSHCDLTNADLSQARLHQTNLVEAKLTNVKLTMAIMIGTDLQRADLTGASVYGVAAWDVRLEGARQEDLDISSEEEQVITVDDLEVAQFIHLLLRNHRIRDVIDTITSKVVLVLGRFTPGRKAVLDAIKTWLRAQGYCPVLFDFEKPASRDFVETVLALAHISRFVVADFTSARLVLEEVPHIVRNVAVPLVPLLKGRQTKEPLTLKNLRRNHRSVLPTFRYDSLDDLLASLGSEVVAAALTTKFET